jgi:uncharacterized protein
MAGISVSSWLLVVATFIVAGAVKGITGMGLPTVAVGILGAFMRPVEAAALLLIPSLVTNLWQLWSGPQLGALAERLKFMMLGILFGTLAAARLLIRLNPKWTTMALGIALVIYAASGLIGHSFSVEIRHERWLSPVMGLVTGLVTGCTGVFVIPAVPYLQSLHLNKDDLIQALGLSFTASTVALAIGLTAGGAVQPVNGVASVVAVAPALIGMGLGTRIRERTSPAAFRRWFFAGLIAIGLELIARSLLQT